MTDRDDAWRKSRAVSLEAHVRGNMVPPLPLDYVDWAGELLDRITELGGTKYMSAADWDTMVDVPEALASGQFAAPGRVASEDSASGWAVRLGDIVNALRIYGLAESGDEAEESDDQDDYDGWAGGVGRVHDYWTITDRHPRFDFRIRVEADSGHPDDFDCYSLADVAAWRRSEWFFTMAVLTPVDRETGTVFDSARQVLGAVEWGTLPGVTPDDAPPGFVPEPREIGREQWWEHPLKDMADAAVSEALEIIGKLAAAIPVPIVPPTGGRG